MGRAQAGPTHTPSDLANTRIPHQDVAGSDVQGGVDVEVDRRYFRTGYRSSAVVAPVRLARIAARNLTRPTGSFDWENLDVIDYLVPIELLDSRRFGAYPVEGQARRVVVNGKSWMTVYGAWRMRMWQWKKPAVHCVRVQLDVTFYRDQDEQTYVIPLDDLIRDHNDAQTSRPDTFSYCLLDVPYNRLAFLSCSRIWRKAVK